MAENNNKFKVRRLLPLIVFILVSLLVLSPQLINHSAIIGGDCWFHMNRAYDAMMQIKTGHFSYFLDLFGFNRAGRIVTGVYGPFGSYVEGLILLLARTWYRWEVINGLVALILSGISVYYVSRKLGAQWIPGIMAGIFYMLSFPFDRWVLNQNFDGMGAILMPWFLLAGYRIFKHHFSSVKLALLVTIAAQLHIMSTFVGLISLLVSFILANLMKHRVRLWIKMAEAMILCLLLTVNVWGSLLEIRRSNYLVPTFPYRNPLSLNHVINIHMLFNPTGFQVIAELIALLILGIVFLVFRNFNSVTLFLSLQSLVFMWITSNYFPWDRLLQHDSMVASYVQFPERFLPLAIAAIILLISRLKPGWLMAALVLVLVGFNFRLDIKNESNVIHTPYQKRIVDSGNIIMNRHLSDRGFNQLFNTNNNDRLLEAMNNRVPDYMPFTTAINQSQIYYRTAPYLQNQSRIINNRLPIRKSVIHRNVAKLTFNARPHRTVQIPFVKYNHTKLWLNHHVIKPKLNQLQTINLKPTKRHNVLEAQYQPSHWYEDLVIVEILTWVSLLISLFIGKARRP